MFAERNWSVWHERINDAKVVIIISLLFTGVVLLILMMTVWNPEVQRHYEEQRWAEILEKRKESQFGPLDCKKTLCLGDLANPEVYRRLQ